MKARAAWPLCGAALSLACHVFAAPDLGICGNRIVEPDEDCDDPDDPLCVECRLFCIPDASDTKCPPPRACGRDGVCRAASGAFAEEPVRIDLRGVRWFAVGDVDGDRIDDVLVQADGPDVEWLYVDPLRGPQRSHVFDRPVRAAVADYTDDGRADVLASFTYDGSIARVRGASAGVPLTPTLLATLRSTGEHGRLLAPVAAYDHVLELVSPQLVQRWSSAQTDAVALDGRVGIDPALLGIHVGSADLDGGVCTITETGETVARREIALAERGASAVHVASTCADETGLSWLPPVALPDGTVALGDAGTFLVDIDADDRIDLLTQDDSGAIRVAWGVGDGSFHDAAPAPNEQGNGLFAADPLLPAGTLALLAVGDVDGDAATDLVLADRLAADVRGCVDECGHTWPLELQAAAIVDINDDGAFDVVGVAGDSLQIHLLDPDDGFKSHACELAGPARELVAGDFDRDTHDDVVFVEHDETAAASPESIALVYGPTDDACQIERVGPFVQVQSIAVENRQAVVARVLDGSSRPAGAFLRDPPAAAVHGLVVRRAVAVRGADRTSAVAIAQDAGVEARLAVLTFHDATLSPHDVDAADAIPGLVAANAETTVATAVDLDGDAIDEVVLAGPGSAGAGTVWVARYVDADALWRASVSNTAPWPFRRTAGEDGEAGTTIAVGDADGDGDLDVLTTTAEVLPRVVVLRNDDAGLSVLALRTLPAPAAAFAYAAIVPWHADADGRTRWLVASDDEVATAVVDVDAATITIAEVVEVGTRSIAAVDLGGDGLRDLLVATDADLRIFAAHERIGEP